MVHSHASTVDLYLSQAPADRAPLLNQVRQLARQVLKDHEERVQWGMAAYVRDGRITFGFADRAQYLSLYFPHSRALERNAEAIRGLDRGKNCLRLRKSARLDWNLLEKLLIDSREGDQPNTDGVQGSRRQ